MSGAVGDGCGMSTHAPLFEQICRAGGWGRGWERGGMVAVSSVMLRCMQQICRAGSGREWLRYVHSCLTVCNRYVEL